jgi:hypothetical protein
MVLIPSIQNLRDLSIKIGISIVTGLNQNVSVVIIYYITDLTTSCPLITLLSFITIYKLSHFYNRIIDYFRNLRRTIINQE